MLKTIAIHNIMVIVMKKTKTAMRTAVRISHLERRERVNYL